MPGPAGEGVRMAAGDSWDCYAGLGTHWGPSAAAAGVASGERPAGAWPETMEGHPVGAVGPAPTAEDHPLSPHRVLCHLLAMTPCHSAVACAAGAGAFAGGPAAVQSLGNPGPGQTVHQAAEGLMGPVPQQAASQAVPCSPVAVEAVAAGTDHGSLPFVAAAAAVAAVAVVAGVVS